MSVNSRLIPISYFNPNQSIRLNAYADIIVYEPDGNKQLLRVIRFGGYPEMVRALADALYAGAELEVEIGPDKHYFVSEPKRFQRQLSHDGLYAEAVLLALDDEQEAETEDPAEEQQALQQTPRNCFLFGLVDDRQYLFDEIDRKTTVPLIPAFRDYLLEELEKRRILRKLQTISIREKLDGWVLKRERNDANIIAAVEDGLRSGAISIPGTVTDPTGFDEITNVTGYPDADQVLTRMQRRFTVLTDSEQLRKALASVAAVTGTRDKLSLAFQEDRIQIRFESEHGASAMELPVTALSGTPEGVFWYNPTSLKECLRALDGTLMIDVAQQGMLQFKTDDLTCVQTAIREPKSLAELARKKQAA